MIRIFQLAGLAFSLSSFGNAAPRPNILLIVSEDNGPELGCYGEPSVKTPNLNRLASKGVLFERAYVPQAGCSQSRAAFLTGLYPHQNGQIGLATWKFRLYHESTPNLVRSLKSAGYRTGLIGKLHINPSSAFPFDFKKIPSANFSRKSLKGYASSANEFITASDKPFFLSINYPDAHRPFLTQVKGLPQKPLTAADVKPLAYFGLDSAELRQQTADYYNCMSRLDSQIGDLLSVLKKSGKLDNTLIVYLGDHGADMLRGKRTSYEGGTRIPLIISWPGKMPANSRRSHLVSTLDLLPTFLAATKAKPIPKLPGLNLFPILKNPQSKWRTHLFTEYHLHSAHNFFPQRTVRNDRFKLIHNLLPDTINPGYQFTLEKFFPTLPSVVATSPEPVRSAYQRMEKPPEFELYDLNNDPHEFTNLADNSAHQKTLTNLKTTLHKWRTETKDPFLKEQNLTHLQSEINASFQNGKPEKSKLHLSYPDYFFKN